MATKIQFRRDTAANWTSNNPTLASGEYGFETNTGFLKIGDGLTAWTSLQYFVKTPLPSGAVVGTTETQTLTNKTLSGGVVTSPAGAGFQNQVIYTTGTAATWSIPAGLQVSGAPFRVILLGGGGQGGGTAAIAGQLGAGGGSGGLVILYLTYVVGQTTATYTVGAGGSGAGTNTAGTAGGNTTFVYNSITYTGGGGGGGATAASQTPGVGGTATGGTLNIVGNPGARGGTMSGGTQMTGAGGSAPLGFGFGGKLSNGANSGNASIAYGAGGSGVKNATSAVARSGFAGSAGIIIIEY